MHVKQEAIPAIAVKHHTSVAKSIIWRALGVVTLGTVTYLFTRNWIVTTQITLVHHAFFLVVFYLHERAWCCNTKLTGRKRNVIKALFYEIVLGMGFGGLIVYIFTSSLPTVTQVTGTYTVIRIATYYIYDRIWPELK